MNTNQITIIVGIAFIPLGFFMSIFSKQFSKVFCKISKLIWSNTSSSMQKFEIVKNMKELAKESYEYPEKTARIFKYIMGPTTIISGIVIVLTAMLLFK